MTSYKQEILECLRREDYNGLFVLLDGLRGPYAAAYLLNALAEDEITENANTALTLLKKRFPQTKTIEW